MGTPDFAVAGLRALVENGYNVVAVVTMPDKPAGRGHKVQFSPVKQYALEAGLPVLQPEKLKDPAFVEELASYHADLQIVVAFRMLPEVVWSMPRLGTFNLHASLLPQYRGAAPIQWAVLNGDKVTGVSTMYLASEMDSGDIIYTSQTEIGEFETSGELFDRLMVMGAELLVKTLRDIEAGIAPRTPQNHAEATHVSMLDKSISPINWNKTPREIVKHIYGLQPWPVATMELEGAVYRVFAAEYTDNRSEKEPGKIVSAGNAGLEIACAGGVTLMITELQAPGKKRMKAADFLRGHKIKAD